MNVILTLPRGGLSCRVNVWLLAAVLLAKSARINRSALQPVSLYIIPGQTGRSLIPLVN